MAGGEAQLKYLDGDFDVVMPGAYVMCAVTNSRGSSTPQAASGTRKRQARKLAARRMV